MPLLVISKTTEPFKIAITLPLVTQRELTKNGPQLHFSFSVLIDVEYHSEGKPPEQPKITLAWVLGWLGWYYFLTQ
jgi:hypothetical protein